MLGSGGGERDIGRVLGVGSVFVSGFGYRG